MNIKPTGLKGGDKIQRIQNLMDRLSPLNESTTNSSLEHIKYGPDDTVYGIIRENHTYFIKTANKTNDKLTSEDFEYIGGLQNKMDESYRSYEDALRHLNMKFKDLNESYGIRENINLFKSDILLETTKKKTVKNEQDEDTTFKLKVDAPETTPTPMDTTTPDMGDVPTDDMSTDVPTDDMETPDETDVPDDTEGGEDTGDLEKDIQRLTGKIGQKMRELDEPDAELEKYVLNSIMSALDIDSMDEDFKEDLISKLEGEDEENSDEVDTEEESTDTEEVPTEEPTDTEEVPEETPMKAEGRVISKKTLLENLKNKKSLEVKLKNKFLNEFHFTDDSDESDESPTFYQRGSGDRATSYDWSNMTKTGDRTWDTNYGVNDEDWEEYEDPTIKKRYPEEKFVRGKRPSKFLKNPNLPDDEDFLREIEKMDVFNPAEFTATAGSLKKGNYGIKDPKTGHIKSISVNEEDNENIYEIELDEDSMEEGNAFTRMLSKTKKGEKFKLGGRSYTDKSDYDELDESDIEEYYSPDEDKEYPESYYEPGTRYKSPSYDKGIDIEFNDKKDDEVVETRQRRFKPFQPKKK